MNEAAANEQLDSWTAHKADSGVVYYYNALTGESTYEKPACFKGEVVTICIFLFLYKFNVLLHFRDHAFTDFQGNCIMSFRRTYVCLYVNHYHIK